MVMPEAPLARDEFMGAVLADRYEVTGLLGEGGMARVYRAQDRVLGRAVALKILRNGQVDSSDLRRQQSEIRLLASLQHAALVTLFDVISDGSRDNHVVLVMQHVDGENLRDRIARDGALGQPTTAAIGRDIATALDYVHARGVVHRDVKPANILLSSASEPAAMLSDFGIARLTETTGGFTGTGGIIGTAHYLSPEQAKGAVVTGTSDIYSLGLVLIECLTGQRCFAGTAIESASARLVRDPELPAASEEWTELLASMTAREPSDRPSAEEVATRLAAIDVEAAPMVADAYEETQQMAAATAATRVLPAAHPTATPAAAAPSRRSVATEVPLRAPSRRSRALVVVTVAASLIAAAIGWWGISTLQPPPPAAVEYAPVEGTLGEQLQRLQEAVAP